MPKSVDEIATEEAEQKAHRAELAREANRKRNDAMLERRNAIADSSDRVKEEEEGLEPLTDEVWDQEDRQSGAPKKTRAELIAEQDAREEEGEDEASKSKVIKDAEAADRGELDEARKAGADDTRRNKSGITEYRVEANGKEKWLTLEQLRAHASGDGEGGEALHTEDDGVKRTPTRATDPAVLEAQRQADERRTAEAAAYKARLKDLYTKASMGDEQAIDELAEIQAGLSRVTPDVLRIVDERVDARVVGRTAFEKAVAWFEDEYSDELSTPRLKAFAARRDREMAQADPDMDPRSRLDLVGKELRGIRTDLGGKPKVAPQTKQVRKASVTEIPVAGGRQRPEASEDEQESTSDAIARMAKGRGQARAIKH